MLYFSQPFYFPFCLIVSTLYIINSVILISSYAGHYCYDHINWNIPQTSMRVLRPLNPNFTTFLIVSVIFHHSAHKHDEKAFFSCSTI